MSNWQTNVREVFDKVINFVSELHPFSAGTYTANQVKAGLFKFAYETNVLLEDSSLTKNSERANFLAKANIHNGMGQDELYDIIEHLEFHMRSKFPGDYVANDNPSAKATVKADFIADKISQMSVAIIENYAHKFDRMTGAYEPPKLVIDNEL